MATPCQREVKHPPHPPLEDPWPIRNHVRIVGPTARTDTVPTASLGWRGVEGPGPRPRIRQPTAWLQPTAKAGLSSKRVDCEAVTSSMCACSRRSLGQVECLTPFRPALPGRTLGGASFCQAPSPIDNHEPDGPWALGRTVNLDVVRRAAQAPVDRSCRADCAAGSRPARCSSAAGGGRGVGAARCAAPRGSGTRPPARR